LRPSPPGKTFRIRSRPENPNPEPAAARRRPFDLIRGAQPYP
jgi:hypothetical protein